MANTTRLGLRNPAGGDAFSIAGDIAQIVGILDNAAIWQKGTLANRPLANAVKDGTVYFSTDTGDISWSNGATWFTVTPALRSNFRVKSNTWKNVSGVAVTKLAFQVEDFDVGGDFDSVTNNQFTAPVKGIYSFSAQTSVGRTLGAALALVRFYKNGAAVGPIAAGLPQSVDIPATYADAQMFALEARLQLNAGDTVDVRVDNKQASGTTNSFNQINATDCTYFSGVLLGQLP